jgi:hypothetical protein
MKRATEIGFWKATGQDRAVQQNNQTVGMIKTLIFHTGKSPRGDRTDWVMHEYRLEDKDLADKGIVQVVISFLVVLYELYMEIYVYWLPHIELVNTWQIRSCAFDCECI